MLPPDGSALGSVFLASSEAGMLVQNFLRGGVEHERWQQCKKESKRPEEHFCFYSLLHVLASCSCCVWSWEQRAAMWQANGAQISECVKETVHRCFNQICKALSNYWEGHIEGWLQFLGKHQRAGWHCNRGSCSGGYSWQPAEKWEGRWALQECDTVPHISLQLYEKKTPPFWATSAAHQNYRPHKTTKHYLYRHVFFFIKNIPQLIGSATLTERILNLPIHRHNKAHTRLW